MECPERAFTGSSTGWSRRSWSLAGRSSPVWTRWSRPWRSTTPRQPPTNSAWTLIIRSGGRRSPTSVLQAVTNHCVRAGTLCEHTCCGIAETRNAERDSDLAATLREMAHGARDLFRRGLDVFETRDIEHSEELEAADDWVDLMYSEAMNLVVNPGDKESAGSPEWRVRAALTVHYLERIADHGVDIGERTVFLVTGERMEGALRRYRERPLDD